MRSETTSKRAGRGIISFLLIAFGIPWALWILIWRLGIPSTSELYQAAIFVGAFGPAIAAIIVRSVITREGFADAGLGLPQLTRRWPYYIAALLWPTPVVVALAALLAALGLAQIAPSLEPGLFIGLLITTLVYTPILWGEEFGWRSYLQIRLFANRPLVAAVGTGLIWGVWHWPAFLIGYLSAESVLFGFAFWPVYTVMISIVMGWLRLRSDSIWAASIGHSSLNMLGSGLSAALIVGGLVIPSPVGILVMIPLGALCVAIILSGQLAPSITTPTPRLQRSPGTREADY